MKDKVILVDCDGVLLDWEFAFRKWMSKHGFEVVKEQEYKIAEAYGLEEPYAKMLIRMFNESAWIRKLPPLRDAIKYVRKLHVDHGFIFHAITSLSDDEYAQHLRTKNLRELFGDTVFDKYVYLDCGADKDSALLQYKDTDCVWVEDKIANSIVGHQLGLDSILMNHHHNENANLDYDIKRVDSWKEIYTYITEGV